MSGKNGSVSKIGLLILLCASTALHAAGQSSQNPSPDSPKFNTEIVVTPERGETPRQLVPAATVVLEAESLPALPAVRLSEIATFLPGFQVQQPEPYAPRPLVSARGFFGGGEAEYVRLLVDGVPIADAESGLIDWSLVPTASIRRIEALRGPGASSYGDSAIGGVIQIFTDRLANGGHVTASGGSFNTFTADGSYAHRSSSHGFLVTGSALRTDGASVHSSGRELTAGASVDGGIHSAVWRWSVAASDRNRDDPGALSVTAQGHEPFASDALFRFDKLDRSSIGTAFIISGGRAAWQHRARAHMSARDEELVRTILLAPGLGDRRQRSLSASAIGGGLESGRTLGALRRAVTVRFGLDLSREHLDTGYRPISEAGVPGESAGEAAGTRLRTGVFLTSGWDPVSRLHVSAGMRWDRTADDFGARTPATDSHEAWSPRVGATVLLHQKEAVSLFAQVSRAFKVPTLDQLFDPRPFPDFSGGTFTISNARLLPQRATNIEAGISGGTRLRWSALAYRMSVDDEIDFDIRTFSYANIGRSRHTGVEVETGGTLWRRVQPSLTYALVRVADIESDRQLKNVPRHVATVSVALDLPLRLAAYARYRRASGAYLDDENRFPIDGPSTLDVRVRRNFGRQVLFLDLLNVGDDRYQEYGFTLSDFRGQVVPYSYSGPPRAVRAGVIASF